MPITKQGVSSLDNYKPLMDERAELTTAKKRIDDRIKELDEALRPALNNRGPVIYGGYEFEVKAVAGRKTYDYKAMLEDGIDLEPYVKVGAPTTRFSIKPVNEI